jgi:hypothetical protein
MVDEKIHIKSPIQVDLATLSYEIEGKKFKLNPKGHLPEVTDKIEKIADHYEKVFRNTNATESERRKEQRKSTKQILELGLDSFVYENAVQEHGYGLLDHAATELHRFFVNGGVGGLKHSLQQLGLTTLNTSNGSEEQE